MTTGARLLSGLALNVSISECADSVGFGYPQWQVNRTVVEISAALLGQGVSVVFGHDWRADGVMEAVFAMARQMQDAPGPTMVNVIPWPDRTSLDSDTMERLKGTLIVEQGSLPPELDGCLSNLDDVDKGSDLYVYARARGLTQLRRRLNELSHARFCLGGRTSGASGRYSGIIEEALLAITDHKPLYLSGMFGGAAGQVISALLGGAMPERWCENPRIAAVYASPPVSETDPATEADRVVDPHAVWETFRNAGLTKLAATNGLTATENEELFEAGTLERAIELVLTGLARLRRVSGNGRGD
jgi:hypothetical protein